MKQKTIKIKMDGRDEGGLEVDPGKLCLYTNADSFRAFGIWAQVFLWIQARM